MLTHRPRKLGTVKMVIPEGVLAPRPPMTSGPPLPKWQRFYNWPRGKGGQPMPDAPDFPKASDVKGMTVEVPADQHHLVILIHKGGCSLADAQVPTRETAIVPDPPKPKKDRG